MLGIYIFQVRYMISYIAALLFHLYPFLDPFFKQQLVACWFFKVHLGVLWLWFVKTPDDYYLITLC